MCRLHECWLLRLGGLLAVNSRVGHTIRLEMLPNRNEIKEVICQYVWVKSQDWLEIGAKYNWVGIVFALDYVV